MSSVPQSSPVFVHSGWRCSSTYVWNRFRAVADTMAYYEPWHEQLAHLTPEWIAQDRPSANALRHPGEDQPYLAEFSDLLGSGEGVAGYEKRFALDDYFLAPEVEDAGQAAYVEALIGVARRQDRTPVLACCRTLGKIDWLRRRFGGTHIVLIRDPVQQWKSFYSLRKPRRRLRPPPRPTYFEQCQYVILSGVAQAAEASRKLGLPPLKGDLQARLDAARNRLKHAPVRVSFAAFLAVYVLSYLTALPQADVVIDIDRLGSDPDYARAVARTVSDLTGVPVDFSDCRTPRPHADTAGVAYRDEAIAMIEALDVSSALRTRGPIQTLYAKLVKALPEPPTQPARWWEPRAWRATALARA